MKNMFLGIAALVTLAGCAGIHKPDAPVDAKAAAEPVTYKSAAEVKELWRMANAAKDCKAQLPLLDAYAKLAASLTDVIHTGLRPMLRADGEQRQALQHMGQIAALRPYNDLADDYLQNVRVAKVMQAECYQKSGNVGEAIAKLTEVLETLPVGDLELWERARQDLYDVVGIPKM